MKLFFKDQPETLAAFNRYRLTASRSVVRALMVTGGVFNGLLLIPDLMHITGPAAVSVIVLRTVYTLMMLAAAVWLSRLKSFNVYSVLITFLETAAFFVFLFVYMLYPSPDYTIQMLGMMVLILLIWLVPNHWPNMVAVSAAGTVGFFLASLFSNNGIEPGHLVAGMIYLMVESALCAIFALYFRSYQYLEYASKSELLRDYATDPLTRIGNRVRLEEESAKWMDRAERYGLPLSLVVIDVDNMKDINDTHGHIRGDSALYELAQTMRGQLRKDDVCVRWGGDEFVLLLPYTNTAEANKLMERMKTVIHEHTFNPSMHLTCSFGIAPMQPGLDLTALIERADESMYAAKRLGKNAIRTNGDTGAVSGA